MNKQFDFNKLDRPATKMEYDEEKFSLTPPCVGHDKASQIEEQVEKLREIKTKVLQSEFSKLATKHDIGKPAYSNLPRLALLEVVKVMTYGANTYGKYNYSGNIESSRLTDALERHLNKYLTNEDIDESSYHHVAHVAANSLMLLDNILLKKVIDDRNKSYKQINESTNKETTKNI